MSVLPSACESFGIDTICGMMHEGYSQAEIARRIGVQPSTLCEWLNHPERSARATEARYKSAESWMDRGLAELMNIPDDGTQAQIARAKEIAQHCRRMAAIRNPRQYGDRLEVEHKGNLNLTAMSDQELMRLYQEQTGDVVLIGQNDPV